uniref:glucose-6-phosphatase n=1 Tax=Romanomermis culicivorax TaxID=13658 RepID=A0A915K4I4_ROMCU
MSDRPYWWIHNSEYYSNTTTPKLDQFEHTCETGPGSPSGHAMVTACVWYVFLMNFTRKMNSTSKIFYWMAYASVLFFIALSRLYVAAHFPHQLVLGIVVGTCRGLILGRIIFKHCKVVNFAELFVAVCVLAFLASIVLLVAYFSRHDLNWSIALAVKYCKNKAWIHVSTTPFTAFYRDLGALLGLGLAADSRNYYGMKNHDIKPSNRLLLSSLNLVLSMISSHLLDNTSLLENASMGQKKRRIKGQ